MRSTFLLIALVVMPITAACESESADLADELVAPDEVAALIDEWHDANSRGDGSVADLYVPGAYHLYGDNRYGDDEIADHLGAPGWEHEWVTPLVLVDATSSGRYVVTRGMRNDHPSAGSFVGTLSFVVTTASDGSLRISSSAWFSGH